LCQSGRHPCPGLSHREVIAGHGILWYLYQESFFVWRSRREFNVWYKNELNDPSWFHIEELFIATAVNISCHAKSRPSMQHGQSFHECRPSDEHAGCRQVSHGRRTGEKWMMIELNPDHYGRRSIFIYSSGDRPAVATRLVATIMIAEGSAHDGQLATRYSWTWDLRSTVAEIMTVERWSDYCCYDVVCPRDSRPPCGSSSV